MMQPTKIWEKKQAQSLNKSFLADEDIWCRFTQDFIVDTKFGKLSISLGFIVSSRKDRKLQSLTCQPPQLTFQLKLPSFNSVCVSRPFL